MKILHTVEFYYPSIGGMQEVVRQLSERLAMRGHQVTVATAAIRGRDAVINGVRVRDFAVSGNLAFGLAGEVASYREFLLNSDFDIITNFAAQQWATDVMLNMLAEVKAKKVFVPTGFSGLYDRRYHTYFNRMPKWMKQYDMNVFLSETYRDAAFAREHGVANRTLIPNGASEEEFLPETGIDIRAQLGIPRDHLLVLHVGSHTGLKGHREALKIFGTARISNATLLIVANDFGRGCGRECRARAFLFNRWPRHRTAGKQVIMTSLSRPETITAYTSADLFLFPSNVECSPLVLFESMASRTPFLTTDVGNAAEIADWSGSGRVLPTGIGRNGAAKAAIPESARLLEELANDPGARKTMQEAGFEAWQRRFTWNTIAARYEQLYRNLAGQSETGTPQP